MTPGEVESTRKPQRGGMASGDVVNTAARLQTAAPVDGVLVGEVTYRATNRMVEYEEAELLQAKGKAEPVKVWLAKQARSRLGSEPARLGLVLTRVAVRRCVLDGPEPGTRAD